MTTSQGPSRAQWRKSTRSSGNGQCIEVANLDATIGVRDSKAPNSGHLALTPHAWATLTTQIRAGHYDQSRTND